MGKNQIEIVIIDRLFTIIHHYHVGGRRGGSCSTISIQWFRFQLFTCFPRFICRSTSVESTCLLFNIQSRLYCCLPLPPRRCHCCYCSCCSHLFSNDFGIMRTPHHTTPSHLCTIECAYWSDNHTVTNNNERHHHTVVAPPAATTAAAAEKQGPMQYFMSPVKACCHIFY